MADSLSMATPSAGGDSTQPSVRPKKKRSLPGMPDPGAEVIALSPKSLMETNKYVCDICGKGFQRDQNLQLHRRGHNLPWKLKQRPTGVELRKRVYVCPEPSCPHHDPSRALGDLTGIKKHFCRKHGEKKFKCGKCSKSYAVLCDWKAHMKVCGTREYPCDCGTIFSRRDSFITHRAFCDALAQESARSQTVFKVQDVPAAVNNPKLPSSSSPPPQPPTPSTGVLSPVISIQSSELPENQSRYSNQKREAPPRGGSSTSSGNVFWNSEVLAARGQSSSLDLDVGSNRKDMAGLFALSPSSYSEFFCVPNGSSDARSVEPMALSLSTPALYGSSNPASMFLYENHQRCTPPAALSATALLQKAAQIGSKSSTSFLQGLGLAMSSASDVNPKSMPIVPSGLLGLGLQSGSSSTFLPMMQFSNKPPTLDFLGLGSNQTSSSEYPGLLSSMNGRNQFGMASSSLSGILGGNSWEEDASDQKSGFL